MDDAAEDALYVELMIEECLGSSRIRSLEDAVRAALRRNCAMRAQLNLVKWRAERARVIAMLKPKSH